jgi:hypothetical protein
MELGAVPVACEATALRHPIAGAKRAAFSVKAGRALLPAGRRLSPQRCPGCAGRAVVLRIEVVNAFAPSGAARFACAPGGRLKPTPAALRFASP